MKVILTMAISANSMIATQDGEEKFLYEENWERFVNLLNKVGCFIWGRKTYDKFSQMDEEYLSSLKDFKKIIISHSDIPLVEGFELAHSPQEALNKLEDEGFKEAVITGGSTINSAFAKENLIDEVILDINPTLLGEGIPLFSPEDFTLNLELTSVQQLPEQEQIVELRYTVKK